MNTPKLHTQVMNIGHALNHFFILIFPTVILVLQDKWGISYADLLKYGSLGVLAYGLGGLPAGWLGDRWNQKRMVKVYFFGMGLSAILTGFSQTPEQLALGVIAIGLFASIYHPVGIALVFTTAKKPGRAIAVNGVAGNIGLACAAVTTAFLAHTFGWQSAFLMPGVVCLLVGVIYSWVSKNICYNTKSNNKPNVNSLDKKSMGNLFLSILIIACLGGLIFQSMTTALPKILEISLGASLEKAGTIASVILILAAVAQIVMGELLDKFSARTLLIAVTAAEIMFLILASLVSGWLLVPVLIALMFCTFGQIPINDWLIGHYAKAEWRSRFYALKYTLGLSVATLAYWLIAYVYSDTGEFTALYLILACVMSLSVLAAWIMPKTKLL